MTHTPELYLPTHEFYPTLGGIGVYIEELATAASHTHSVSVFAPIVPTGRSYPFHLRALGSAPNQHPHAVIKTAWVLRKACLDAPQAQLCLAEPAVLKAAMLAEALGLWVGNPHTLILHGSEMQHFHASPLWRPLFGKLLRRAQRVGVVSHYNARWLSKHFGVSEHDICLAPGALRGAFLEKAQATQARNHDTAPPLTLLTVGRIHPRKGQHAVLEALALLPEAVQKNLHYRLIGPVVDSTYQAQLEALAQHTLARVSFEGSVDEATLQAAYAEGDVFALTSMPHGRSVEGLGMVYLEAGAYGLPSVAHRVGGVEDAVLHEKTGLLTSPADRSALAAALLRLLRDGSLRQSMGAAAREHATSHTWADNVRQLFG